VLDLGAGTGVSTEELALSGAYVVGVDISLGMLRVGRRDRPTVPLVAGDALALPFPDKTFDAVTTSFVIRNVANTPAALRELARVTKPGGRLVICEFSHPTNAAFRKVYLRYLMRSLPAVARRVSSNPDAYAYLAESIQSWPDQAQFAAIIGENSWSRVGWRNLSGGIVALHRATRA
jgi:demethylmenaquinone methyltransferase/2-methoxy-6-polyprenyl-1,4-benzoquinol methylase